MHIKENNEYLFYDIECANTFDNIGKIISIGIVVTDNNFNLLTKKDIIIDPENRFDPYFDRKNARIKLAYDKSVYLSKDNFKNQYNYIKEILERNYLATFGFAVKNDLKFIYDSCNRYNLEQINLKSYDVKTIAKLSNDMEGSLTKIVNKLSIDNTCSLSAHRSDDDAHMTMLVLKEIVDKSKTSVEKVINKLNIEPLVYNEQNHLKAVTERKKRRNKQSLIQKKNEKFNTYYEKVNENPISLKYEGYTVSISNKIKREIDKALVVAKYIYDNGGVVSNYATKSNYIIAYDKNDKRELYNKLDTTKIEILTLDSSIVS